MAVKLPDTLVPMADFPSAFAKHIQFTDGENLQDKLNNGKLGGSKLTGEQTNNIEKIPTIEGIVTSNSQAIANKADKEDVKGLSAQLDTKASKNEVFSMANMGQDIKEAMTGGSVAVVGRNTILPVNVVDKSLPPSKTTFSVPNIQLQLFDRDNSENLIGKVINSYGNGTIEDMENRFVSHKIDVSSIKEGTNIGASCILNGETSYLNVVAYGDEDKFIKYQYRYITKTSNIKYIRISGNLELLNNCVVTDNILGNNYRQFSLLDGNKILLDKVFLKDKVSEIIKSINTINSNINKHFDYKGNLTESDTIDKVLKNGFYIIQTPCNTLPDGFQSGFLISFSEGNSMSIQIAISYDLTTVRAIRRVRSETDISEWVSLINNLPLSSNLPLSGEKGLCMGDSITMFGKYPQYISELTGGNFLNCGFGGTRISYNESDQYKDISFIKLCEAIKNNNWASVESACTSIDSNNGNVVYTNSKNRLKYAGNPTVDWSDVKYITLAYGTNDFGGSVILDNEDNEYDISTILGAFRQGIKYIQEKFPTIKIYVFTPCFRSRINNGDNKNSDDYPDTNGVYLSEICDALENECKKMHIPCKNMYYSSQVNKYTATTYLSDGVHRTDEGYKLLGSQYSKFILSN